MLGAVIHPKNYILPLLRGHFCARFPEENFLIYDAVHQAVLLYQNHKAQLMELAEPLTLPPPDEKEQRFQELWRQFYKTLEIKAPRPYLLRTMGLTDIDVKPMAVRADFDWLKPGDRQEFVRVRRNDEGGLDLYHTQNSQVLSSCAWADGLFTTFPWAAPSARATWSATTRSASSSPESGSKCAT